MQKRKQAVPRSGVPPQVAGRDSKVSMCSTAAILARGVTLAQVLLTVRQLRPLVQKTG